MEMVNAATVREIQACKAQRQAERIKKVWLKRSIKLVKRKIRSMAYKKLGAGIAIWRKDIEALRGKKELPSLLEDNLPVSDIMEVLYVMLEKAGYEVSWNFGDIYAFWR